MNDICENDNLILQRQAFSPISQNGTKKIKILCCLAHQRISPAYQRIRRTNSYIQNRWETLIQKI